MQDRGVEGKVREGKEVKRAGRAFYAGATEGGAYRTRYWGAKLKTAKLTAFRNSQVRVLQNTEMDSCSHPTDDPIGSCGLIADGAQYGIA